MSTPGQANILHTGMLAALMFAAFGTASGGTNYYVSTTGSDAPAPAHGLSWSSPWRTITYAISQAADWDTINVASGIYNEVSQVYIYKKLTIRGVDSSAVVTPLSGGGFVLTSNNVTLMNIQVRGARGTGISASNVSNVTLMNVYCIRDSNSGVQFTNLTNVTVTGGSYSYNKRHGFNTSKGSNYTISSVKADSNGWGVDSSGNNMIGSGICLVGIRGTSVATNLVTRYNRMYGLVIGDNATGITVDGGIFRKNGKDRGYNGGGIFIYSDAVSDSNITIQGNVIADSNATAGIWIGAQSATSVIKNIQIGQSGTTTLASNGGAGLIILGNVHSVTATGNFTRGNGISAAGVIVVGKSKSPPDPVPSDILIKNSTFNAGYDSLHPAITLDDGGIDVCNVSISADGNTFAGATTMTLVEYVIHDSLDNASLGRVHHTNDKPLPVELVSFDASTSGNDVILLWSTATEVNNFGFEVQRLAIRNSQFAIDNWRTIGFLPGSGTSNSPRSYSFSDRSVPWGAWSYRLKQIDRDGTAAYSMELDVDLGGGQATEVLGQNFPNPFNPRTTIEFAVPVTGKSLVAVYNLLGQRLTVLFDGVAQAGTKYQLQFDASRLPSGVYFYRLESGQTRVMKRMLVVK